MKFTIQKQPDDTTCGPTCLHAVYSWYGQKENLDNIIGEVKTLKGGGTLAVMLGIHALKQNYSATLYSYNLRVFDPTWANLGQEALLKKLSESSKYHKKEKLNLAINSYMEFLKLGGKILFEDMSPSMIVRLLRSGKPILTGLSSTYLYRSPREYGDNCDYDDIRGIPSGHFVVLYGYEKDNKRVLLADPWSKNPISKTQYYKVGIQRLVNSILLGVLTYDGNLLIIEPAHAKPDSN